MKDTPAVGNKILLGVFFFSLAAMFQGQAFVRATQKDLNATISSENLWKKYRWSFDPMQRREAALILAGKSKNSPFRQKRLLLSQGWGTSPIAAVAIKFQAKTEESLGDISSSRDLWKSLLRRFPLAVASADSYYFLGRHDPKLRQQLLDLYPAHPASLASAVEFKSSGITSHQAAVHLARWGPRWHGAEKLIRNACQFDRKVPSIGKDLEVLALGLSRLGDGGGAMDCLQGEKISFKTALVIGKSLMKGDYLQQIQGKDLLMKFIHSEPNDKKALEAISLISGGPGFEHLERLPRSLLNSSPGYVAGQTISFRDKKADDILNRWIDDPDIWELQWNLTRHALLEGEWSRAIELLNIIPTNHLPEPFAARNLFWKGFLTLKQQRTIEAKEIWEKLVKYHPHGYYTWRALARLGRDNLPPLEGDLTFMSPPDLSGWTPLGSSEDLVNQLWRLGLYNDAWEIWRSLKIKPFSGEPFDLDKKIVEGRLRMAVGDDWNGLFTLWQTSLMIVKKDCHAFEVLKSAQHPYRYLAEIASSTKQTGVRPELILAIIKEESRFSPTVISASGAVGLMQVMPSTAIELSEIPLTKELLLEPEKNIHLGGAYLAKLFRRWKGNPWLTISSYNAGPIAVGSWLSEEVYSDPELWVERIPYPETRFYTKKVLGSLWSYLRPTIESCSVNGDE